MASKLIAEQGIKEGMILSLNTGDEWIAGRDPDVSQLIIEDPEVSRKHLHLKRTTEGIVVENLSETNPALINGEQLTGPTVLQTGDKLTIGNGTYRFEADSTSVDENLEEEMEPEHDSIFDENAPAGKDALAEINYELVDTGRWLLKVIGGPNNGAEFAMQTGNTYTIGTDPNSCDIVFHDTSVSRQHAKITVNPDDTLAIEDLKSRNGTLVDGEPLKTKRPLLPNTLVTMGTTSFIVYDREGEMQTVISPLLPSIVKVLQKEEPTATKEEPAAAKKLEEPIPDLLPKAKAPPNIGGLIVITIVVALASIIGIGIATLFRSEPISVAEQIDYDKVLSDALAPFPSIKWSYNKSTGRLFLVGHLLTAGDRNQLLYNLQGMKFIKGYDDSGVIIDEYVWQDINQLLANNPNWKGITVQSPSPGHFVLLGYLQTRKQAEQLSQYMSENFRYLDLLQNKVVVDEDVISQVTSNLQSLGLKNLAVQISNGELTLSGSVASNKLSDLGHLIDTFKTIPGVRNVKNYVTELPPEASLINISDKYTVTGYSHAGKQNLTVVINGRILSKGDVLDGMTITDIKPNSILLEKDRVKYQIDYSK